MKHLWSNSFIAFTSNNHLLYTVYNIVYSIRIQYTFIHICQVLSLEKVANNAHIKLSN